MKELNLARDPYVYESTSLSPHVFTYLVIIRASIGPLSQPPEAVQIKLALKGGDLCLPKILMHYYFGKVLGLSNDESPAVRQPADDG